MIAVQTTASLRSHQAVFLARIDPDRPTDSHKGVPMDETANSRSSNGSEPRHRKRANVQKRIGALLVLLSTLIPARDAFAQQDLPVVSVAKPVARNIVEDDEFVGRFEAVDEVDIRSRVSGYLS